jgi:nucleoid-associated protein YgaU
MGFLDNVKKNLGVGGKDQDQDGATAAPEGADDANTAGSPAVGATGRQDAAGGAGANLQDTDTSVTQDAEAARPGAAQAQPGQPRQVMVEPGDTLAGIAAQFGVSVDALLLANADTVPNPDLIYPGQVLRLP